MGGESSRHVDDSGAAPDVGVPLNDDFPLISPLYERVDDEGTEVDDESEIISVGGPLSIVGGCESEGVAFEEAVGGAGFISETKTALETAGLPICWFSNFSIIINFLLGFHTGQLFDPLY